MKQNDVLLSYAGGEGLGCQLGVGLLGGRALASGNGGRRTAREGEGGTQAGQGGLNPNDTEVVLTDGLGVSSKSQRHETGIEATSNQQGNLDVKRIHQCQRCAVQLAG